MASENKAPLQMIVSFLIRWLVSVVILFFSYLGIFLLGIQPLKWYEFLIGVIPIGFVFALLLETDRRSQLGRTEPPNPAEMSAWGLIHELFVNRKSLFAFFALAAIGAVLATYYVATSLFTVQYADESGIVVQFPGERIYYIPVHPYFGWQVTNVHLDKGEQFTVEISGLVSPGSLQNLDKYNRYLTDLAAYQESAAKPGYAGKTREPQPPPPIWPFVGPEGYPAEWYPNHGSNPKPYIRQDYMSDEDLTVKGLPHITVVATILESATPRPPSVNKKASYDWKDDKNVLLNLSCDHYPQTYTANASGNIWVVINDADNFRWDNSGWFLLKVTKHFRGLPRENYRPCKPNY